MTGKKNDGAGKPRKIQAPLIAAAALTVVMIVYLAAGLGLNGTSKAASVSSAVVSDTQNASAGSENPQGTKGPSGTIVSSGAVSSAETAPSEAPGAPSAGESPSSGAAGDEYVLPAGPQAESRGASQEPQKQETSTPENQSLLGKQNTVGTEANPSSSPKDDPQTDGFSGPEISRGEYDSLQKGMTYEEVEAAVGSPGTLTSGSGGSTKIYKWSGYGSSNSYAQLTFRSGKLSFKIQFGL